MVDDLISIVVPVYNVENFLEKCLESMINQTYKNIQIILVDDGSTDKSGHYCDNYLKKDNRITVIHKKNGGLSDARNAGIKEAKGKYITFVDSDDYLDLDYIEYLYNLIKNHNTNISFCRHRIVTETRKEEKSNHECKKTKRISKTCALKEILYGNDFEVSAWAKMYLTEQFSNIKYPKGKLFEDNATTYKLIEKNDYIAIGYEQKYNYLIRNGSITNRNKVFSKSQEYLIEAVDSMCNSLEKYTELKDAIYRKKYWARISTLNRMIDSNYKEINKMKELRKDILSYKMILKDKRASLRDKMSYIMIRINFKFYKKMWSFYKKTKKGK